MSRLGIRIQTIRSFLYIQIRIQNINLYAFLFKDGEMISRQVGVAPKQTYEDAINSAL